jgi:sec-independent protein translocase protein TatB
MFDIGWSELVVIGVVALIAIGPKELPGVLRMIGQWMGKLRRMASEFQGQFNEAMREAEMDDLKKQVDELNSKASGFGANFDPLGDMTKFDDPFADKPKPSTNTPASDMPATDTSPGTVSTASEPSPPTPPADTLPTSEAIPLPAPPDAEKPAGEKPA